MIRPAALLLLAAAAAWPQIKAPATYDGVIANGLRVTVVIEADGSYVLRETVLTATPFSSRAERGGWKIEAGSKLILTGGSRVRIFQIRSARSIRPEGESRSDLWLAATHQTLNDSVEIRGLYTSINGAGSLKDCLTGKTFAVAQSGRYVDLERAYDGERRQPGVAVLAALAGHFSGNVVVPDALISVQAGGECERAGPPAIDGSWKLMEINGRKPPRPATLIFAGGRASGNSGCNRYGGSYRAGNGSSLRFGPLVSTQMACLAEGAMQQESDFLDALGKTTAFQLDGGTLRLLAGTTVVMRLVR